MTTEHTRVTGHSTPFTLAVCAEMVHTDLPLTQRVERIGAHGVAAEIWDWSRPDVELDAIAGTGVPILSMTGYRRGDLITDEGIVALLETARESAQAARTLQNSVCGTPRLNLHGTGLDGNGIPLRPVETVTGDMWVQAARTLEQIAALGEELDVVFELENLNRALDHPGVPFGRPEDALALVAAVGSPHLRLNLDLYHAQIGEGNLIETCRKALPWIGQVQVADVPGRNQPGTGEIAYKQIALALADMGYSGIVAMEAWAAGDPDRAIDQFIEVFSEI